MRTRSNVTFIVWSVLALNAVAFSPVRAFEGRIEVELKQGNQSTPLLYTVSQKQLRVEIKATNWPNPVDILDLRSGALTLIFPHNRSFVRLKTVVQGNAPTPPADSTLPVTLPPGGGPQWQQRPEIPQMASMPILRPENVELKATGKREEILGLSCEQFELKAGGETMEIWASDQLIPFQPYLRNQVPRFGPPTMEERLATLLPRRNMFPVRATVRLENGAERFRFEVKKIIPEVIADQDGMLFRPPADYFEAEPLASS